MAVSERTAVRRWAGAGAFLAGLLLVISSFLVWFRMPDDTGGWTTMTGWGSVGGGAQITGTNLNDAIAGYGSYRPGLVALIVGTLAVVLGLWLLGVPGKGPRPHRITATLIAVLALVALGWAGWRLITPDSLGITDPGEAHAGLGQWLTGVGGLVLLGVAAVVLAGLLDPPVPVRSRGIQR